MKEHTKTIKTLTRAVCVTLAVAAAFGASAFAYRQRSLRELRVRPEPVVETMAVQRAAVDTGAHYDPLSGGDFISLQGYADSVEKQAMEEWSRFLSSYDADGSLLAAIGNGSTGLDSRYDAYGVYTQEMADALDGVAEKYGLVLHGAPEDCARDELFERVGGRFLTVGEWGGYLYPDGTFQCDEEGELAGYGKIMYQLRRTAKGVFDEVGLNVTDVNEYEQWEYQSACGKTVLLALGPDKAMIFADLPGSFVAVNVLAGTGFADGSNYFPDSPPLTAENLETLADSFDFSLLG